MKKYRENCLHNDKEKAKIEWLDNYCGGKREISTNYTDVNMW